MLSSDFSSNKYLLNAQKQLDSETKPPYWNNASTKK